MVMGVIITTRSIRAMTKTGGRIRIGRGPGNITGLRRCAIGVAKPGGARRVAQRLHQVLAIVAFLETRGTKTMNGELNGALSVANEGR